MQLGFLKSVRFWKLFFIGAVTGVEVGFPGNPFIIAFATMIQVWFGGSVINRTADRFSETLRAEDVITGD